VHKRTRNVEAALGSKHFSRVLSFLNGNKDGESGFLVLSRSLRLAVPYDRYHRYDRCDRWRKRSATVVIMWKPFFSDRITIAAIIWKPAYMETA